MSSSSESSPQTARRESGDPISDQPIWHREYWDRYMRNQKHFDATVAYIHENPVKANLCYTPEVWKWSSAWSKVC